MMCVPLSAPSNNPTLSNYRCILIFFTNNRQECISHHFGGRKSETSVPTWRVQVRALFQVADWWLLQCSPGGKWSSRCVLDGQLYDFNLKRQKPPLWVAWASQVALVVKNTLANAGNIRDSGSIPGSGRSPGGGHGSPLQYSCLENPHGQGSLAGYSP